MKYCSYCGHMNEDECNYCVKCGRHLDDSSHDNSVVTTPTKGKLNNRKKNVSNSPAVLVAAICGAILFGALLAIFMNRRGGATQSTNTNTEATIEASNQYTITFMGNGASYGETSPLVCEVGKSVNLPACGFTRKGYAFDCWEDDDGHQYSPGDMVRPDDDVTFWAVWTAMDSSENGSQSASAASRFPMSWTGNYVGYSQYVEGGSTTRTVQFVFSEVSESGDIKGVCYIGINDPDGGTGSYYVDGHIDWATREIELHGTRWYNQQDVKYMRVYRGTVSADFGTINGSCEMSDGTHRGDWSMRSQR